jgi:hypothetical protein
LLPAASEDFFEGAGQFGLFGFGGLEDAEFARFLQRKRLFERREQGFALLGSLGGSGRFGQRSRGGGRRAWREPPEADRGNSSARSGRCLGSLPEKEPPRPERAWPNPEARPEPRPRRAFPPTRRPGVNVLGSFGVFDGAATTLGSEVSRRVAGAGSSIVPLEPPRGRNPSPSSAPGGGIK